MSLILTRTINWGDLNGELLNLILSKLFGKDRLSFSLVCKHWNAVAANSHRYSPCLVNYYRRTRTLKLYQYNSFFDISFPELENAELRCSKYGWMLMSRYDDTLFFFDPSNNRKLELPGKVGARYIPLCFFNPPTSPECVVVGITYDTIRTVEICTLKLGEGEWEILEFSATETGRYYYVSFVAPVLHCGLIYFLFANGNVGIFDIEQRRMDAYFDCIRPESVEKYNDIREQYLVKVKGDDALYGVFVFDDDREVNVLRLSCDMQWDLVEEDGIGDKLFYVSTNSSFGVKAPSESMQNKICFPMFRGDVPVFYSLSDAKYQSIDGEYSENNAYRSQEIGTSGLALVVR